MDPDEQQHWCKSRGTGEDNPHCQGFRDQLSYNLKLQLVMQKLFSAKHHCQERPLQAVQGGPAQRSAAEHKTAGSPVPESCQELAAEM